MKKSSFIIKSNIVVLRPTEYVWNYPLVQVSVSNTKIFFCYTTKLYFIYVTEVGGFKTSNI